MHSIDTAPNNVTAYGRFLKVTFRNNEELYVFDDGAGYSSLTLGGEPRVLWFESGDAEELLGQPYQQNYRLGYPAGDLLANAEHEALHLFFCSEFLGCISPNHLSLTFGRDALGGKDPIWLEAEEVIVTSLQLYCNNVELSYVQRLALGYLCQLLGVDIPAVVEAAQLFIEELRAAYQSIR